MKLSDYKSYSGSGHCIALCFDRTDEKRVLPVIKELYKRGVRTRYLAGFPENYGKYEEESEGLETADITVIVRSADSAASRFIKSVSLYLEDRSRKIVFLDFGSLDTAGMSTGLKKEHPTLEGESTPAEIVDSLIHEEGFVQDIFCDGFAPHFSGIKLAAVIAAALAVLIFAAALLLGKGYIIPAAAKDTVTLTDKSISRGARYSIGNTYNISLNEDNISSLEVLYLDDEPETFTDLEKFPNLKTVVMPMCSKKAAEYILGYDLELILYGGQTK